ncbi:MAG: ATP cone domain-containing protein [Patescibacteria group bacterium]|nr:ATP cone domain-containing protein [Patescibacteria group bacterium]
MADRNEIKVEKRDGQQENYSNEKVVSCMVKAGATEEQAKSVAAQVNTWVQTTATAGIIRSVDIRTKVLELLHPVNPEAVTRFEAYSKPQ